MQFFFCSDDIERCVKDSHHKWIIPYSDTQERPHVPTIWPVKIGTNLTRNEIIALENAGFQLPQRERVPLNQSFNNFALPMDFSSLQVPKKSKPLSRDQEVQMCSTIQYWSFLKVVAQHQLNYGFRGVHFEGDHDSSARIWLHHFFTVKAFTYRFCTPIDLELLPRLYAPGLQRNNIQI